MSDTFLLVPTRAQLKQRALVEMRHRAVGAGFRPGVLRGEWSSTARKAMRADALSRRAEAVAGSRLLARQPHANVLKPIVIGVAAIGGGIAIGYAIGKWIRHGKSDGLHLLGAE